MRKPLKTRLGGWAGFAGEWAGDPHAVSLNPRARARTRLAHEAHETHGARRATAHGARSRVRGGGVMSKKPIQLSLCASDFLGPGPALAQGQLYMSNKE